MNTQLTPGDAAVKGLVERLCHNKPRPLPSDAMLEKGLYKRCDKRFYEAVKAALAEALSERYPDPADRADALIDAIARADAFGYAPHVIVSTFGAYDRI